MIKLHYPDLWLTKNIISTLLLPFSFIYRFLAYIRASIIKPVKLDGYVICIGNPTVGGSGKTQLVKFIAAALIDKKYKVLVVTKGYGSTLKTAKLVDKRDSAAEVGDEAKMLSIDFEAVATKSIKFLLPIIENIRPDIIIFDDGLQNPAFKKDLSICVIDAERSIGNNRIFPAGPLREPLNNILARSDIVVTVGNQRYGDNYVLSAVKSRNLPFFTASIEPEQKFDLTEQYYAFSGLGNNKRFFDMLREKGLNIEQTKSFPDHHSYSRLDILALKNEAKSGKFQLITTAKDYVKIVEPDNILCAEVKLKIRNKNKFLEQIDEKIKKHI